MNENIKELAAKAGWAATADPYTRQAFDINMFAQLLVSKCADIAACNGHVSGFTLHDVIKEHFGVE